MPSKKTPKPGGFDDKLISYGDNAFSRYLRTVFLKSMGYTDDALDRPIIGIANTYSAYNSCHATVPKLMEAIKRGIMLAGGLPFEFPVISLHESFTYPTSMYLRNLMSMDTEEMVRAQPMDAVVLIGGCDKTVPALLMGAASAGTPAILEVTGPMLTGSYQGQRVGACTDCRHFWARFRAGEVEEEQLPEITDQLGPTPGTCMVMGHREHHGADVGGARRDASRRRDDTRRNVPTPSARRADRHARCRHGRLRPDPWTRS